MKKVIMQGPDSCKVCLFLNIAFNILIEKQELKFEYRKRTIIHGELNIRCLITKNLSQLLIEGMDENARCDLYK